MQTATDRLSGMADGLIADVRTLLRDHSTMYDINERHSELVWIGAHYGFLDLSLDGRRLQSKILGALPLFISLLRALLAGQSEGTTKKVDEAEETIRGVVEQRHLVWHSSPTEAAEAVEKVVGELVGALHALYDPVEGLVALVPDTSALLYNPVLANWSFPDLPSFTVVLVPGVLSELDDLIESCLSNGKGTAQPSVRPELVEGCSAHGSTGSP